MTIIFDPLYPGAHLEVARLGDIEVGRVMDEGKGAAWTCILPPVYTYQWTKARSIETAREALEASVTRWISKAGLQSRDSRGPFVSVSPDASLDRMQDGKHDPKE